MKKVIITIIILIIVIVTCLVFLQKNKKVIYTFDGESAFIYIEKQVSFGPRYVGGEGYEKVHNLIKTELNNYVDEIIIQELTDVYQEKEYQFKNIIARIKPEKNKRLLIGTHYDSRFQSELDLQNPEGYMPGANDSASGVAVLLQLGKEIKKEELNIGIDLVFFDGEEGFPVKNLENWYPIGSKYFASNIDDFYTQNNMVNGIIIDMIGDSDLQVYVDRYSYQNAKGITEDVWRIANALYPENFIDQLKYSMVDDHTFLNEVGIPTTLLIDFDYPYFHTMEDSIDKVSGKSLEKVGVILLNYIYGSS